MRKHKAPKKRSNSADAGGTGRAAAGTTTTSAAPAPTKTTQQLTRVPNRSGFVLVFLQPGLPKQVPLSLPTLKDTTREWNAQLQQFAHKGEQVWSGIVDLVMGRLLRHLRQRQREELTIAFLSDWLEGYKADEYYYGGSTFYVFVVKRNRPPSTVDMLMAGMHLASQANDITLAQRFLESLLFTATDKTRRSSRSAKSGGTYDYDLLYSLCHNLPVCQPKLKLRLPADKPASEFLVAYEAQKVLREAVDERQDRLYRWSRMGLPPEEELSLFQLLAILPPPFTLIDILTADSLIALAQTSKEWYVWIVGGILPSLLRSLLADPDLTPNKLQQSSYNSHYLRSASCSFSWLEHTAAEWWLSNPYTSSRHRPSSSSTPQATQTVVPSSNSCPHFPTQEEVGFRMLKCPLLLRRTHSSMQLPCDSKGSLKSDIYIKGAANVHIVESLSQFWQFAEGMTQSNGNSLFPKAKIDAVMRIIAATSAPVMASHRQETEKTRELYFAIPHLLRQQDGDEEVAAGGMTESSSGVLELVWRTETTEPPSYDYGSYLDDESWSLGFV